MHFTTDYKAIISKLDDIDPLQYAHTRNFINGAVTYLSPYISRGIITLPQVRDAVMAKGYRPYQIEKFLQELTWREYYQRVWWHLEDKIFDDIKHPQQNVLHYQMPLAVVDAKTGITAVDEQITYLYNNGYMHNHVRMYIAGIVCNIANAHWKQPSRWMYYHLLDGDLASNTCSWQWVAGSFSNKKYIANQENINKYLYSDQHNSFLDKPYENIFDQKLPAALEATTALQLKTKFPKVSPLQLDYSKSLLLYNTYTINTEWRKEEDANRILVLSPTHFEKYAVSEKVMEFMLALAKNIEGLQLHIGEASEIPGIEQFKKIYVIEHPLTKDYPGKKDNYWWMFPEVTAYSQSFFSFWKRCKKYLKG